MQPPTAIRDRPIEGFSSSLPAPLEHRQLPEIGEPIVTDDVDIAVIPSHFEVTMIWRQPRVEYLLDSDPSIVDVYQPWRLFATVTGVAFDTEH
jgi:hypothetical protein